MSVNRTLIEDVGKKNYGCGVDYEDVVVAVDAVAAP